MGLRQRVMDEFWSQFDLIEFYHLLFGSGAMLLDIMEQVVDSYFQRILVEV